MGLSSLLLALSSWLWLAGARPAALYAAWCPRVCERRFRSSREPHHDLLDIDEMAAIS